MNKYSDLSVSEKLTLDDAGLARAATLEAIDRGISPPTKLSDALQRTGARGWWMPAEAHRMFEICAKERQYGEAKRTGIAFPTEEAAMKALEGAYAVTEEGYDAKKVFKFANPQDSFEVRLVHMVNMPAKGYWTKLTEMTEDNEKFDAVIEECRADLENVRQKEYDRAVLQDQRRQYLELANGDEAVASAFWSKTKHSPWPEAPRFNQPQPNPPGGD